MTDILDISHSQEIYSVSRFNREVRFLLEDSFPAIWIEGEISNFAAPSSGHWYFCLKDALSQVRCCMFRPQNRRLVFLPKDGMHVLLKVRVSLYEGRGEFQLLVEHMEEAGEGKLRQEFEALKKRLQAAGLFEESHKKSFPPIPKKIGIITSPTGAAIKDILSVLKRRFACIPVVIYPTLVQGDLAADNIVKAIQLANKRVECDVLILARGGGSLEDLWSFNEEKVAYAIFHSEIPIISGVGHEIDFTIADFVADKRAPTPSAAAELIVPDIEELNGMIEQNKKHFIRLVTHLFQQTKQHLVWTQKHLYQLHPKHRLREQNQKLDSQEATLVRLQIQFLEKYRSKLQTLHAKLLGLTPHHAIRRYHHQLNHDNKILNGKISILLSQQQQKLEHLAGKLDALSPLAILKRGFAIATREENHRILRHAKDVTPGDKVNIKLMEGELSCIVKKIICRVD